MYSFKNPIIRFFVKFLILLITVFILDQLIGAIINHFYFRQVAGASYRTTYSMDSTTADILVFGSSRANHHYVPSVFEDKLKMTFYNTGKDGNRLLYSYAILNAILNRYTPKIIILDIGFDELYFDSKEYDNLSSLLPYYKDHQEIRKIIELRSPYERIKLLSAIYPYNSNLLSIGIGNLELNKTRKEDRNGYVPLLGTQKDTLKNELFVKEVPIDSLKVKILDSFAKKCLEKKIRLIFVQSPIYIKIRTSTSTNICKKIANKHNALFFDYSNDSMIMKKPYFFYDKSHLNDKGAYCFSEKILKVLNSK